LVTFLEERSLQAAALTAALVAENASWYLQTCRIILVSINIGKFMMPVLPTSIEQMQMVHVKLRLTTILMNEFQYMTTYVISVAGETYIYIYIHTHIYTFILFLLICRHRNPRKYQICMRGTEQTSKTALGIKKQTENVKDQHAQTVQEVQNATEPQTVHKAPGAESL
jgi:hypothetical protein